MSLKNWDNKTWLSSKKYIQLFSSFLLKNIKLNRQSLILDIGCGRGKILGSLSTRLKLKNKPIGIDIEAHDDRDKRIYFRKIDATRYFKRNTKKFDLILIKQTIHLLEFKEIKDLIFNCKNMLNHNGKIFILTLDTFNNEIPTFSLMKKKLKRSLKRDEKIIKFISHFYPKIKKKKFVFNVKISKKNYVEMIKKRYISTLLSLKSYEIIKGIDEINERYKKILSFDDKLICLILEK